MQVNLEQVRKSLLPNDGTYQKFIDDQLCGNCRSCCDDDNCGCFKPHGFRFNSHTGKCKCHQK